MNRYQDDHVAYIQRLEAELEAGIEAIQRIRDNWQSRNLADAVNQAEDWATGASELLPEKP